MANVENLLQLKRVVENAPEHRFHMTAFIEAAECGTAYCAAGFAAIDPWFQENTTIGEAFKLGKNEQFEIEGDPFDKLQDIFELDKHDTLNLFGANISSSAGVHDVTKEMVLDNIDRAINGEDIEPYPDDADDAGYPMDHE
jgi:hypothetical protein